MLRLILLIGGTALAFWLLYRFRRLPADARRATALRAALLGAAAGLILLAATGRIHWLGIVIGALLPLLKPLLLLGLNLLPLWRQRRRRGASTSGQAAQDAGGRMSRSEALAVLGLEEGAGRDAILRAHRQLMQHCHPDRGGSDYLAAKLNAAKETLLGARGRGGPA